MTSQVQDPVNKQIDGYMGRGKGGRGDLLTGSGSIGDPMICIHKIYIYIYIYMYSETTA